MSAATDTTANIADGDVAADVYSQRTSAAGDPQGLSQTGNSALGFDWARLLLATLARTVLILSVSMAAWASVPAVWGWQPTTVMSGSMEPAISTGDVVVARPMETAEYKPNRVVLVDDPDNPERLRLHRIVESNDSGQLVLRGDANNDNDSSPVSAAAVHGVGFLSIPYVGLPVQWIQTAQWLKVIGVVVGFIFMCWASNLDRDLHRSKHRANPPTRGRGDSAPEPGNGGLEALGLGRKKSTNATMTRSKYGVTGRRSARIGAAVLASALVLGTVPVASQAAFTATSSNANNVFTGARSCGDRMLDDGASVLYKFDSDTGSTVADSVAPGVGNGTFQGVRPNFTQTIGACAADRGKSAVFDGTSSHITSPVQNMAPPANFAYEMWFRPSTAGGKLMTFTVAAPTTTATADNRTLQMLGNGTLRIGIEGGTKSFYTTLAAYEIDKWHHVVVTWTTTRLEIWVNGQLAKDADNYPTVSTQPGAWVVGTGTAGSWTTDRGFFKGEIDNVAIYHGKVLTATQIAAHYSAGRDAMRRP